MLLNCPFVSIVCLGKCHQTVAMVSPVKGNLVLRDLIPISGLKAEYVCISSEMISFSKSLNNIEVLIVKKN